MIALPPGVRVYLACGCTDMRNYAESPVMLHGPEQIATRGRLNSPPEAGSNRHLRPVNSPPPGW